MGSSPVMTRNTLRNSAPERRLEYLQQKRSAGLVMIKRFILLTGLIAALLPLNSIVPARAGGPVYAWLKDLPPPIAKLHTCIGPRQRTLLDPNPRHVGRRRIFAVGCPENAPNITLMLSRDDSGTVRKPDDDPDNFQSTVYYLADDARGRNARRIVLRHKRPDGTTVLADAFRDELTTGWSTREETSMASGLAFFDVTGRRKPPPGEFMVSVRALPPERPEIKNVVAYWHVKNGTGELIYWAETAEDPPKDGPPHRLPPYKVVLDKRPEK
jgi:hypothetical protein